MASKVVARKSGLHGMGLFAARDLEAGEKLIEYKGVRYGKDELPDLGDDGVTKFLRFSDGTGIDGKGWAALANHGCDPNCEVAEEEGHEPPRAWLYALRDVKKGEELVWDYRLDVASREEAFSDWACACGAEQCRGTMADPEQVGVTTTEAELAERPDVSLFPGGAVESTHSLPFPYKKGFAVPLTSELVDELNTLIRFDLSCNQQGVKVHKTADAAVIAAANRLYHKGLLSLPDGGYLTSLGRNAAEHAQAALALLTEGAARTGHAQEPEHSAAPN